MTKTNPEPSKDDGQAPEAALADLSPRDRELVRQTMINYPQLTVHEALRVLKEFGGL